MGLECSSHDIHQFGPNNRQKIKLAVTQLLSSMNLPCSHKDDFQREEKIKRSTNWSK